MGSWTMVSGKFRSRCESRKSSRSARENKAGNYVDAYHGFLERWVLLLLEFGCHSTP